MNIGVKRKFAKAAAIFAVTLTLLAASQSGVEAAKAKLPPYRASGVIPGTELEYEKLAISDRGDVVITIVNPTNKGVAFTSKFSFYSAKDKYLTGFAIEGFASANRKAVYSLELDDYRAYRRAATMKVLGRSGRMGKDPDKDNGSE
jgi:hypothetical protein